MLAAAIRVLLALAGAGEPELTGIELDPVPREILIEILVDAGLPGARVSSYGRTPAQQASEMHTICARDGVAAARRLYSRAAHSILDAYERNKDKPRDQAVAAMTVEVERVLAELGPNRRTMMHVGSARYTFDVAPSSLADPAAFERALARHPDVARFFRPGGAEKAFHLEVERNLEPLAGTFEGECRTAASPAPKPAKLELRREGGARRASFTSEGLTIVLPKVSIDRRAGRFTAATPDGADVQGNFPRPYALLTLETVKPDRTCSFRR